MARAADPKTKPRKHAQTLMIFMKCSSSLAIGVLFGWRRAVRPAILPMTVRSPVSQTMPEHF